MNNINTTFGSLRFYYNIYLRIILTYLLLILVGTFMFYVSTKVSKHVNETLSITIVPSSPQVIADELANAETLSSIQVKKGDTFQQILKDQYLSNNDIEEIIKLLKRDKVVPLLQINQVINFEYELRYDEEPTVDSPINRDLIKMSVVINEQSTYEITKDQGKFTSRNLTVPLTKTMTRYSVPIGRNLSSTLKNLGLSSPAIRELINAFNHQIDFQRQLKFNDTITVISEKMSNSEGKFIRHGKIMYASLNLSGKNFNIYHYSLPANKDATGKFYTENAKSVKRSLLRTPVNIVKISSKYGQRKHPILGYTKMHKGVDFKAPAGTPIFAAGDGVITKMGWGTGYGNYIQIKHSSTLSTLYGHASKLGKNLAIGSKVKQGQVIGYVGMTGHATGPHLHYEVKIDGKNVNPMSIKTSADFELAGNDLKQFEQYKKKINSLNVDLTAPQLSSN